MNFLKLMSLEVNKSEGAQVFQARQGSSQPGNLTQYQNIHGHLGRESDSAKVATIDHKNNLSRSTMTVRFRGCPIAVKFRYCDQVPACHSTIVKFIQTVS